MKRLVLCFDGTWNTLRDTAALTNVVKLANLVTVNENNVEQISYYNSGVGGGGPIDRYLGGLFGVGLKNNVKRGLTFLALNYEDGDEIYLFGFSRGAYTARAVAGVIGTAGIPRDISNTEKHWETYQEIAKLRSGQRYPKGTPKRLKADAAMDALKEKLIPFARNTNDDDTRLVEVRIKCVGVWDTVGAYGIPLGFGLSSLARSFTYWTRGFRDTHFGTTVDLGLHAVAIDERRRPFAPTFWTRRPDIPPDQQIPVEQVWFAGVHSNIGGGYDDRGLSDLALVWMMAEVQKRTGLRFNEGEAKRLLWPCSAATLYKTTRTKLFNPIRPVLPPPPKPDGLWSKFMRMLGFRRRRFVRVNERLHWSVRERCGYPATLVDGMKPCAYKPPNLPVRATEYTEPLPLEIELADHSKRDGGWVENCPMLKIKQACACKARDLKQLPGGPVSEVGARVAA